MIMTVTIQRPQDPAPMTIAAPDNSTLGWTPQTFAAWMDYQWQHNGLVKGTKVRVEAEIE